MSNDHRSTGNRWFEEVWNKGRREAVAEFLPPDGVLYEAGAVSRGPEGFYPFFDRMRAAFSDIRVTVEDTIGENDKFCYRWICSARHTGDFMGFAATGKTIEITGIAILRVENGKMIEAWQNWDMLGLVEQISAKPHAQVYTATV